MANVTASVIVSQAPQADGRIYVAEAHTDVSGAVTPITWLAEAAADLQAALAAHAFDLGVNLQNQEIAANVAAVTANGSVAATTFVFSTQAQNLPALRDAYRNATRTEAIMIGDFLSSLTNAQLQSIFSMTSGQVTTLRANKLTPAASAAVTIRAAAGQ